MMLALLDEIPCSRHQSDRNKPRASENDALALVLGFNDRKFEANIGGDVSQEGNDRRYHQTNRSKEPKKRR